jgi:hypothetical protein
VLSGVVTGVAAIAALSYYRQRNDSSTETTRSDNAANNNSTTNDTTPSGRGTSRLRRSRHVRIRRGNNRNNAESNNATSTIDNEQTGNLSDNEDDADTGKMLSLFKEWGDDDNRNLLNLLHAISENQSRKGE